MSFSQVLDALPAFTFEERQHGSLAEELKADMIILIDLENLVIMSN
jgi:hypothetical protein